MSLKKYSTEPLTLLCIWFGSIAQWQSVWLLIKRLWVQIPLLSSIKTYFTLKQTLKSINLKNSKYFYKTLVYKQLKWVIFYWNVLTLLTHSFTYLNPLPRFSTNDNTRLLPQELRESQWQTFYFTELRKRYESHESMVSVRSNNVNSTFDWFKDYWLLHQSKGVSRYSLNREFKLMFFVCTDGSGVYDVVALSKFYTRWETGLNLLYNLAFFQANLVSFSNKLFIEESLAFNWEVNLAHYKLFKFSQNVLYFKDSPYGEDTKDMFLEASWATCDAVIVSDVKTHQHNSFFLRTSNIYSIGLVPANYSPWVLSFGIPLMGDSILGQYYFINLVLQLALTGSSKRFDLVSKQWDFTKRFLRSTNRSVRYIH